MYEFSAPRFFDLVAGETEEEIRQAQRWFEVTRSYAPSRMFFLSSPSHSLFSFLPLFVGRFFYRARTPCRHRSCFFFPWYQQTPFALLFLRQLFFFLRSVLQDVYDWLQMALEEGLQSGSPSSGRPVRSTSIGNCSITMFVSLSLGNWLLRGWFLWNREELNYRIGKVVFLAILGVVTCDDISAFFIPSEVGFPANFWLPEISMFWGSSIVPLLSNLCSHFHDWELACLESDEI